MPAKLLDGWQTDPEPDVGGEQITARNMRSKCRCSNVLQFTFRRAVCCVLHRPPSQVIHCIVWFFYQTVDQNWPEFSNDSIFLTAPHEGGEQKNELFDGRSTLSKQSRTHRKADLRTWCGRPRIGLGRAERTSSQQQTSRQPRAKSPRIFQSLTQKEMRIR